LGFCVLSCPKDEPAELAVICLVIGTSVAGLVPLMPNDNLLFERRLAKLGVADGSSEFYDD